MAKRKGKGKARRRIKDWHGRLRAGENPDDIAHRGQKPGTRAVKLLEGQVRYCVVAKTFRAQPQASVLSGAVKKGTKTATAFGTITSNPPTKEYQGGLCSDADETKDWSKNGVNWKKDD